MPHKYLQAYNKKKTTSIFQVLSFGMIVSSALMIWKGLMVGTGSESPIVVVLSGSMEPAFHRYTLEQLNFWQRSLKQIFQRALSVFTSRRLSHRLVSVKNKKKK